MSNKELEIVIDTITAADRRFTYNETLTLENVLEPEVISAYFAEKTVKKESLKDGTYQYTFDKETSTDSKTKRSNVVKAIHKSINDELSSQHKEVKLIDITKVINEKETGKKWPLQSHAKDSTLTFDQYKNETKIYYKKISSAPMGYQVYLITETKNLKDKKVKIKIHEKEEGKEKVLKLLKTKDDALPVKVFAKKEDTTTDTEVSDWIEIEVKEENGNKDGDDLFLYKEENENKIEVGIKKIQLRPKEDKIKTEGEDAHKSYEGWQEALYIREDETDDGKKAIEDSETLATTRTAETFITLTRDADADKKENKKSYPKKISGPEDIGILGKDAVFTIDKYKSNATTKDKNNIRWCIYVDDKSTVIDAKSKAGLYTYAKSELIDVVETTAADGTVTETGGTNKLTIVFDKALEGKTIQIEPYRGAPDHKVEKDWVYENTIKGIKISKRETTALWLTSQCDSVESPNTTIKKDFIGTLKLITPNTIHVYHDGKMSKLNLEGLTKVKYRYHDKNGEKHNVCECEIYETLKMGSGNKAKVLNTIEKASATIVDYKSKNITGVSAYKSYILGNQDVYTEGEKGSWGYTHVYYKALNEKITMVKLPYNGLNYKNGDTLIKFVWHQTLRRFSQPEVFAAFIGALAKCGFKDIKSGGSCYEDGSSYPSLSHNNGYAIDTSYIDNTREQKLINALKDYGFLVQYKGTKSKFSSLTGATALGGHNDHLHSGGAPKNGTIKFKAKYK